MRDGRPRLLVVEDEPTFRRVLERALAAHAEVVAVESVEEALRWLGDHPCDAVLSDLHLPGRSGAELAAALATTPRPPRVALLTGDPNTARAVPPGVTRFAKPVPLAALVAWLAAPP